MHESKYKFMCSRLLRGERGRKDGEEIFGPLKVRQKVNEKKKLGLK